MNRTLYHKIKLSYDYGCRRDEVLTSVVLSEILVEVYKLEKLIIDNYYCVGVD